MTSTMGRTWTVRYLEDDPPITKVGELARATAKDEP
jgi:hypothetical protein